MKTPILLYITLFFPGLLFAQFPGSGNALDFDGANDVVEVTDNQNFAANNIEFTIEFWIKTTEGSSSNNAFVTNYGGTGQTPFFMLGADGSNAFFWIRNSSSVSSKPTTAKANVVDGTWHHLAGVRSSTSTDLYLDGVLVSTVAALTSDLRFGSTLSIMDHFNRYTIGQIDEIRIWNEARSQTQIRDNMCKRLTGSETNLYSYYNLDGITNTALGVTDNSGNGLDGTMLNMTNADIITSGAPIGNESAYSYSITTATSLNIASPLGDDLTANITALTTAPSSVHVYRVDEEPNVTTPPGTQTQLSQLVYYGVKVFGGTGVTYTLIYNYDGHTGIIDENDLELASRNDNADATWAQESATLNTGANTLTLTGQTGTEYILASIGGDPLPIELLSFEVQSGDKEVEINWQTATEINNDYFEIERSSTGISWETIKRVEGAGNSSSNLSYTVIDQSPYFGTSYYRLKQTDFDGTYSYSQMRSASIQPTNINIQIFPNPAENLVTIIGIESEIENIDFYNALGQNVTAFTKKINSSKNKLIIDLTELNSGLYYLKLNSATKWLYKR